MRVARETYNLIFSTFPKCLADLIYDYFVPKTNGYVDGIKYGIYEKCMTQNNMNYSLYDACREGYVEIAKLCIARGDDRYEFAFHSACYWRNRECMQLLIDHGAIRCRRCDHCAKICMQLDCKIGV